jgi:hypothetical protein
MIDKYDTPWKKAVTDCWPEFMAFFFPATARAIDWGFPHAFLDQDLTAIRPDAAVGARRVDQLVRVRTHARQTELVYVHLELQQSHDPQFAQRMFTYHYRLFDYYDCPVASLALLSDRHPYWRPDTYRHERLGARLELHFPIAKVLDFAGDEQALRTDPNPFALVTLAHVMTQNTRGAPQRRAACKLELAFLLAERGWDAQRQQDLFDVLDWMLRLPRELEEAFWVQLRLENKRRRAMSLPGLPWSSSYWRDKLKKMEQHGMIKGERRGLQQGRQQGRQEARIDTFIELVERRFGPLPLAQSERIRHASAEDLQRWYGRLFEARTVPALLDDGAGEL